MSGTRKKHDHDHSDSPRSPDPGVSEPNGQDRPEASTGASTASDITADMAAVAEIFRDLTRPSNDGDQEGEPMVRWVTAREGGELRGVTERQFRRQAKSEALETMRSPEGVTLFRLPVANDAREDEEPAGPRRCPYCRRGTVPSDLSVPRWLDGAGFALGLGRSASQVVGRHGGSIKGVVTAAANDEPRQQRTGPMQPCPFCGEPMLAATQQGARYADGMAKLCAAVRPVIGAVQDWRDRRALELEDDDDLHDEVYEDRPVAVAMHAQPPQRARKRGVLRRLLGRK